MDTERGGFVVAARVLVLFILLQGFSSVFAWWTSVTFGGASRPETGNRITGAVVGFGVLVIAIGWWRITKERWANGLQQPQAAGDRPYEGAANPIGPAATMDKSGRHKDDSNNESNSNHNDIKNSANKHSLDMRREEKGDSSMPNRSQSHRRNRQGRGLNSSRQSRKPANSSSGSKKSSAPSPPKPNSHISGKGHTVTCVKAMRSGRPCLGQPSCLGTLLMGGRKVRTDGRESVRQRGKAEGSSQSLMIFSDSDDEKREGDLEGSSPATGVPQNDHNNNLKGSAEAGDVVCEHEVVSVVENVVNEVGGGVNSSTSNDLKGRVGNADNIKVTDNMAAVNRHENKCERVAVDDLEIDGDEGDIDFPSLYEDITFDENDGDPNYGDSDDDDLDDDELTITTTTTTNTNNNDGCEQISNIDVVGGRSAASTPTGIAFQALSFNESDSSLILGNSRSTSASPRVPSEGDGYAYPFYLRPDILDLLNEKAKHCAPPQDPWCVRSPVFQSTLRNFVNESLLDGSICELGACIFVNVMTNGLTEPLPQYIYEEGQHLGINHASTISNGIINYNGMTGVTNASVNCGNRPKSAHSVLFSEHTRSSVAAALSYKGSNNGAATSPAWGMFNGRPLTRPGIFNDAIPANGTSQNPQLVFASQQKLRSAARTERPQSGPARTIPKQTSPFDELTELFSRSSIRAAAGVTSVQSSGNPQGALGQNAIYVANNGITNGSATSNQLNYGSRASTPSFGHPSYPIANGGANACLGKAAHHQHQSSQQPQQQQNQFQFLRNGPAEGNSMLPSSVGNRLGAHLDVLAFPTASPNGSNQYSSPQQSTGPQQLHQLGSFWQGGAPYSHQQPQQQQQPQHQQHSKQYSFRANISPYARYAVH